MAAFKRGRQVHIALRHDAVRGHGHHFGKQTMALACELCSHAALARIALTHAHHPLSLVTQLPLLAAALLATLSVPPLHGAAPAAVA